MKRRHDQDLHRLIIVGADDHWANETMRAGSRMIGRSVHMAPLYFFPPCQLFGLNRQKIGRSLSFSKSEWRTKNVKVGLTYEQ